jgi:uncharacterized protein YggE
MKKVILILALFTATIIQAQETKQESQIHVLGEGKIKVIPDEAIIRIAVENKGKVAANVKKKNDESIDKVLKTIKNNGILTKDMKTEYVNLSNYYDYELKEQNYNAIQTISIHLKDLKKYENLMIELLNAGVNQIQGVSFMSSKIEAYEKQARKIAFLDAKQKALDYVEVLDNQNLGKVLLINENSNRMRPEMMSSSYKSVFAEAAGTPTKETLAIGELEVTSTVAVIFLIE